MIDILLNYKHILALNRDNQVYAWGFKGGPNARLIFNIFDFCVPSDRVGSDEFGHTGKSVKFGPVWQTEALQSRRIRFS